MKQALLEKTVKTMMQTDRMRRQLLAESAAGTGLSRSAHMMLMHLARRERCPSQRELAQEFGITPAAVTGVLKHLEGDGYITREAGRDTRYNEITITERGRAVVEESRLRFRKTDEFIFAGFDDSDLEKYVSILERMQENMRRTEK